MSKTETETREFHAEVRQLLDLVIHSLYTDREIFIRELISNASDALEKLRLTQLTEKEVFDADLPLEINITTDETAKTITIADYGIGMTRDELAENLDIYMPGGASDENIQLLTRTWGAYFGEVLRRMGAGQWVEADNPHGAVFELPGESFSPHDRVRERMQQGADFSLAEFAKKISQ